MEENYLLAKRTISSKYMDSKYYPLLVVSLYVLLEKYPDYKYMIIGLFEYSDIIIDDDRITNILKKNNISYVPFEKNDEYNDCTFGISSSGRNISFKDGEFEVQYNNPIIICSNYQRTNTELLNIFLHEMNHVIKGSINSFYFHKNDNDTYYAHRTGLSTHYCRYDSDSGNVMRKDEFVMLDEVVNSIQASELTQNVFSLDGIVDEDIQNYINTIDKKEAEIGFGYEEATRLFRPLWENDNFSQLVEDNIVAGDISNIINEYESIVGEDSLTALSIALDIINDSDLKQKYGKKYKMAKKYIKKSIKRFTKVKKKVLV